ncbi:hypothetical protein BAUCODRAFT_64321 [Baudoinia panamericana UAMH 10762]|uniref:BTB domain-containing protein n=1 Tax=Baudoinia panamericana (strain UAMH 10762) TaxID=717646 RepID=M2NLJ4_BAUPA|nr:uncharacterized protein BAUCODRAFT_64321 [Baudoinia panamericana UAMH 10762]EMD00006.1 hypothetical protein BAUCODRAFT_64321 [Baudoinia panamericana UAMH 10762]
MKYTIHKDLLTSASPFFAAALGSTFAEGMEQTVRLPEEKPDIFEWFLQWLYTGSLTTPHNGAYGSPKYFLLIDLYALSDRLLTTTLSNDILSTIARLSETTNSVPTPSDTFILYDSIRDTSPLRTLILDLFAYKKTDKLLETHKDDWHPRFLRELVVKLKRPGPEAIERHSLEAWRPRSWSSTKGCEGCKEACRPNVSADRCALCEKVFCGDCLRRHGGAAQGGWCLPLDTSGCKPWMGRNLCLRYHEHVDGDSCR